jgi:predicted nucleic acid-binding protein
VVIDTDVFSAGLHAPSLIAAAYEPLIVGRPAFISFQTVAEIRFGAALRTWGPTRILKMEARISSAEIVHSGPALIETYTRLRVDCHRAGHALAQSRHDADRWIAATAIRIGIPLVSNDRIFADAPGLTVETLSST